MVVIRKIETREEIEKREKRRTRMIVALTLLLLLGSTAGYAFLSSEKTSGEQTGQADGEIRNIGGAWVANFSGEYLSFSNSPNVTENTSINIMYNINSYYQKQIYVSSESKNVYYEIASTLGKYGSGIQEACYGSCTNDIPEKNCTDFLIIYNQSENENKIYQEDNCVFIVGNMKTTDAFLYRVFGLA